MEGGSSADRRGGRYHVILCVVIGEMTLSTCLLCRLLTQDENQSSAQDRWDIYTNSYVRGKILNVSTCTKIHKILRSCVVHLEVGTRKILQRSLQDPKIQRSHWIFTRSKDPDPRNR